jgi:hypothetical protein
MMSVSSLPQPNKAPDLSLSLDRSNLERANTGVLAESAYRLASAETNWATAGTRTSGGATHYVFSEWLNGASKQLPPLEKTAMCCWEWAGLAALTAGCINKDTLCQWNKGVYETIPGTTDQQQRALFGEHPISALKITYKLETDGSYSARIANDSTMPIPGQLISIDGLEHVAIAGRPIAGSNPPDFEILSLPRYALEASPLGIEGTKPFVGSFNQWLSENVQGRFETPSNTNLPIAFGNPSFMGRTTR